MSKPYPSVRVFKSDFLEKFTHIPPVLPLLVWGPFLAVMLYYAFVQFEFGLLGGLLRIAMGLFVWTFVEYFMHRFVFHFKPQGAAQERLQYLLHGLHHVDPQDPTRLVMPPVMSITLSLPFFAMFYGISSALGSPMSAVPFSAGFVIGYLGYDYTHYAVHHFVPRTQYGKNLKQHHMLHHFADHHSRWGVSSALWDYIMGTTEPRQASSSASSTRKTSVGAV